MTWKPSPGQVAEIVRLYELGVAWDGLDGIARVVELPLHVAYWSYVRYRRDHAEHVPSGGAGNLPRETGRSVGTTKDRAMVADLVLNLPMECIARMHGVSDAYVGNVLRTYRPRRSKEAVAATAADLVRNVPGYDPAPPARVVRGTPAAPLATKRNYAERRAVPMQSSHHAGPIREYPRGIDHIALARRYAAGEFDARELSRRLRGHAPQEPSR